MASLGPPPTICRHLSTFRMLHIWLKKPIQTNNFIQRQVLKSNVRLNIVLSGWHLKPISVLPPIFQEHLQSLAYGSLPSIDHSRWHLKPISDNSPIQMSFLSLAYDSFPIKISSFFQMASVSPFPHYQSTASAN